MRLPYFRVALQSDINIMSILSKRNLNSEFWFHTSRSSGKGGQHVNKTSSRVEVFFNIAESKVLSDLQKNILQKKLAHKISSEGNLRVISQATRSAIKNKEIAIDRIYILMERALTPKKLRIPTGPSRNSKETRLKTKHFKSEKKQLRGKINLSD